MSKVTQKFTDPRPLIEKPLLRDGVLCAGVQRGKQSERPARSVTVNLAESPLGWLQTCFGWVFGSGRGRRGARADQAAHLLPRL